MDELILGLRRATKSVWNREDAKSNGFRLSDGEPGYDKTNHIIKIGDGVSKFANLPPIGGGTSFDGGIINNSTTILADGISDLKYFGIQYKDEDGNNQHFRMNANNSSDYLSLTSSDSRIGTILSIKYDGTSNLFYGSVSNANTITLKRSNIYTTTSTTTSGSYGLALKKSDIIGANAVIFADECGANSEGILFPRQNITSDVGVKRSSSDFYNLRGYRDNLYFDGNSVITSSNTAQTKKGNFYVLLGNGETGQKNIGVQFYKSSTLTQLYLMYNSSTGYSALYHSQYGSVLSINESNGTMVFNGVADNALAANSVPASGVTGTLPIAHGGTGSTTAAGARSNLATPQIVNDKNNYWQLKQPNGNDMSYMRTPPSGIIPASQGAGGNIGTSSWKFHSMYAQYGYFDNITGETGWMKVGSQLICWGTFTKPYNASSGTSSNYYGDMSGKVNGYLTEYPVAFSSVPISISITCNQATTQIINLELNGYNRYGITNVRVHRTSAFNDTAGLKVSWVALGPA